MLLSLASMHIMRNYAVSRSLSSPADDTGIWKWTSDSDKVCIFAEPASVEYTLTRFSTHFRSPIGLRNPIRSCY
jgi:hypothetical protein